MRRKKDERGSRDRGIGGLAICPVFGNIDSILFVLMAVANLQVLLIFWGRQDKVEETHILILRKDKRQGEERESKSL